MDIDVLSVSVVIKDEPEHGQRAGRVGHGDGAGRSLTDDDMAQDATVTDGATGGGGDDERERPDAEIYSA